MNQIAPPKLGHLRGSHRLIQGLAISVLLTIPTFADSIAPASVSESIATGGSVTIHKTVTVNAASTSKVDVIFMADNTGSMGAAIAGVKSAASGLLSALTTGTPADWQFGVAMYRDHGDVPSFELMQDLTPTAGLVTTAINSWVASGGADTPEAYQYALQQVANVTSWRPGSERFVVWFGDAPSHPEAVGSGNPAPEDIVTTADAIAALVAKGIRGEAVDVGSLDSLGQATAITSATGGSAVFHTTDPTAIAPAIDALITGGLINYTTVSLDTTAAPAGVGVTFTPPSHVGTYDRSVDRTFDFDVTFTGVTPGVYDFDLYGTVDGARVATERDHIVVGSVPDAGSTLMLLAGAFGMLAALRRRFHA